MTEKLSEAEKRGDEEALRELLERKREALAAMKNKSASEGTMSDNIENRVNMLGFKPAGSSFPRRRPGGG